MESQFDLSRVSGSAAPSQHRHAVQAQQAQRRGLGDVRPGRKPRQRPHTKATIVNLISPLDQIGAVIFQLGTARVCDVVKDGLVPRRALGSYSLKCGFFVTPSVEFGSEPVIIQ